MWTYSVWLVDSTASPPAVLSRAAADFEAAAAFLARTAVNVIGRGGQSSSSSQGFNILC